MQCKIHKRMPWDICWWLWTAFQHVAFQLVALFSFFLGREMIFFKVWSTLFVSLVKYCWFQFTCGSTVSDPSTKCSTDLQQAVSTVKLSVFVASFVLHCDWMKAVFTQYFQIFGKTAQGALPLSLQRGYIRGFSFVFPCYCSEAKRYKIMSK